MGRLKLKKRVKRLGKTIALRFLSRGARVDNYRGRGIESARFFFAGPVIEDEIAARMSRGCRVLEIGCGHGRMLLELAARFPGIELDGLNRFPTAAVTGSSSLAYFARRYGLPAPGTTGPAPRVHFGDAARLAFADGTFDVIVSQVTLQHVERKDLAIQEAWRVLKPGGIALLQLDVGGETAPDVLRGETPRFVVYRESAPDSRVPFAEFVAALAARGIDAQRVHATAGNEGKRFTHVALRLDTRGDAPLDLGLEFDRRSSFHLATLKRDPKKRSNWWWGFRSVYRWRDDGAGRTAQR